MHCDLISLLSSREIVDNFNGNLTHFKCDFSGRPVLVYIPQDILQ